MNKRGNLKSMYGLIKEMYESGAEVIDIVIELGISKDSIYRALGLETEVPFGIVESKVQRLQMELEDASAKILELEKGNTHFADTNTTILKTERDLYKSQYESLLERVIAKAV